MDRVLLWKNACVMLAVTAIGMLGLIVFIQNRNWPMVGLFSVAEPAAAVITVFLLWRLIRGGNGGEWDLLRERMNSLLVRFLRRSEPPLTPAQRWGLVAGGLLTEINAGGYESLWFPFGRDKSREYLRDGWSAPNEQGVRAVRDWLVRSGHRVLCAEACRHVRAMQAGLAPYDPSDKKIELYRWIARNLVALERSRLVAWDFTRLVNVARWGYTAGYIDQDTAWQWILEAAKELQESYSRWEEIGHDFILGYHFWSGGEPPPSNFIASHEKLSKSPSSPWQTIPWRMALIA